MNSHKGQTENKKDSAREKSKCSLLMAFILFAWVILKQILKNWMPGCIAEGVDILILGLALYPSIKVKWHRGFLRWALWTLLFASSITILCGVIELLEYYLLRG
jgi:hypothetical protein